MLTPLDTSDLKLGQPDCTYYGKNRNLKLDSLLWMSFDGLYSLVTDRYTSMPDSISPRDVKV